MAGSSIQVNIVASDRPLWNGEARSVTVPAADGLMGILPNHEPILTVIQSGRVSALDMNGTYHTFDVSDGFFAFDSNVLTVAVEKGSEPKVDGSGD
ncbi:F0F1 ATP synthase subunit epsilon [Bifidobacterium bombi]|uniref:F0F1 ATP synthase, epsilon subunit n=1 Tax=Bifidobacterium bombi DSM 19703 TaxID=1341695 RepID=A0A080N3F9_9BIFI|nr:F0F1 ATP synthase subunit epsilon [Bifidobacterium bombi]KFF31516.1 F0F1 ATP synthase, epsilon subunit [Bifidobacterium bombi DSM 19703]